MNAKNIFKLCVIGSLGMATLGLTLVFNASPAAAHGERSQEPFLRMRTAQWYDTRWNPQKTAVNDEAMLSGKLHISEDWPRAVVKPNRIVYQRGKPEFGIHTSQLESEWSADVHIRSDGDRRGL